jgi:hypothetical protein
MQDKLLVSDEVIELYDPAGKLLGRILPAMKDPLQGWEPLTPELSDDELKHRMEYDGPGISTDDLIARLRGKE